MLRIIWAIPDEFSVTGYNNSIMAVSCEPELTSVDNKLELLCQTTVQHMIALLEKQEEVEQQILVPCEIVMTVYHGFLKF